MLEMDLKKECDRLELDLRQLRFKKANLEGDVHKLEKSVLSIKKDISILGEAKDRAASEAKKANFEFMKASNDLKSIKKNINDSLKTLDNREQELKSFQAEHEKDKEKLSEGLKKLGADILGVKEERKKLAVRQASIDQEKAQLSADKTKALKESSRLEGLKTAVLQKEKELDSKRETISKSFDKVEELMKKADERNSAIEKNIVGLKQWESDLKRISMDIDLKKKDLADKEKEAQKKSEGLIRKEKALTDRIKAIDLQEKELKIKALQMIKIAKEDNIDKRIELLEKELKADEK